MGIVWVNEIGKWLFSGPNKAVANTLLKSDIGSELSLLLTICLEKNLSMSSLILGDFV